MYTPSKNVYAGLTLRKLADVSNEDTCRDAVDGVQLITIVNLILRYRDR